MEPRTILLTVDSNVQDVVVTSSMVRALLDQLGLDSSEVALVELCVMEAMVNIVRHAYKDESGGEVRLRLLLGESEVTFEVEDDGEALNKETLLEAIRQAVNFDPNDLSSLREGGRGMLIIHQVMDEWDCFRRGYSNVLRMRKSFQPRE